MVPEYLTDKIIPLHRSFKLTANIIQTLAEIVIRIRERGLRLALAKSEALNNHPDMVIEVEGSVVPGSWGIQSNLTMQGTKITKKPRAKNLAKILSNVHGLS